MISSYTVKVTKKITLPLFNSEVTVNGYSVAFSVTSSILMLLSKEESFGMNRSAGFGLLLI